MKPKLLLIGITLILISCLDKKSDIDNIELMAYNWSIYNDTTREMVPVFFKCRMYAKINKYGEGNIYKYIGYPEPKTTLFNMKIEKELIDSILYSATTFDTSKFNNKNRQPRIYDGPTIKLRINYSDKEVRLFNLIDEPDIYEIHNFLKLYSCINSTYSSRKYNTLSDTIGFEKYRLEFVRFAMNYDTTNYPKVPPPSPVDSISVKYVAPKNKE